MRCCERGARPCWPATRRRSRAAVRGYRILPPGNTAVRHGVELGNGVTTELGNVLHRKPRSILVKLAIGFGLGPGLSGVPADLPVGAEIRAAAVPGHLRAVRGDRWRGLHQRPELGCRAGARRTDQRPAAVAPAVVARTSRCSCWSALSVWCSVCCWPGATADFGALLLALGELVTMMLIWLGIGNVLSVLSPLRVEPLKERLHDGTLKPFLFSFAMSYVVGLGVNLMLTWRVWAKHSMIEELGGVWVPVLMLIFSAFVLYLLLTVLAVSLVDLPRIRRTLLREMIDYKAAKAASNRPAGSRTDGDRPDRDRAGRRLTDHRRGRPAVSTSKCWPPPCFHRRRDRQRRVRAGTVCPPTTPRPAPRPTALGTDRPPPGRPCVRAGRRWSAGRPGRTRKAGRASGSPG